MDALISAAEVKALIDKYARGSDHKLVVVLGAGASRGHSRNSAHLWPPPTVIELFDDSNNIVNEVINKPEHAAIKGQRKNIERSIKGFGNDLEAYLSDLYQNDKQDARFPFLIRYLEDIFALASERADLDDNCLQTFLSRIRDLRGSRPWTILSFNYDTILERSIASLPIFIPPRFFQSDANYLDQNPKVVKMHGGINHRYISVVDPQADTRPSSHDVFTEMMSNSGAIETYLEVNKIDWPIPDEVGHRTYEKIGGRIIFNFPLMMIPIHTLVRSENSFFGRQIELAKADIAQSKLVVAAGYQFGDNHFVESLKDVNLDDCTLILVGSHRLLEEMEDSRAYKEASKVWPKKNIRIFDGSGLEVFADVLH